jgi:mono/diheme cytochrome c family protein
MAYLVFKSRSTVRNTTAVPSKRINPIFRFALVAAIVFGIIVGSAAAQEKVVKTNAVAIAPAKASSGIAMYTAYCAACHGADGKGSGPAGSAFKHQPTDLTMLSKKNNGKFPSEHFNSILKFGTSVQAHGSAQMPVWYSLFRSLDSSATDDGITMMRIKNLREYIETLQAN